MHEQKVLVTGGAGYIGSHACKALQQAGFTPVTFDSLVTGWSDAVEHGCMDFVFSSTCATYGDQDGVVLDEDSAQHPINAYGASKRAVENILADYQVAYGLNHEIFAISMWRELIRRQK